MKEDGELSDEEVEQVYIPVDRPAPMQTNISTVIQHSSSSSSSEQNSSDDQSGRQKKKKLSKNTAQKPTKFNKYNIWTNALQEESLMENLRGCDVNNKRKLGRNVEDYDYSLKYKLNDGETSNKFKRRKSNSDDGESHSRSKIRKHKDQKRELYAPRKLLDLVVTDSNIDSEIASDIAEKLQEEKSDLILRIVKTVGFNICNTIYEETKETEAKGGMMIMNGRRRRTAGGVFLYLLKNSKQIDELQFNEIFKENKSVVVENQQTLQLIQKDRDLDLLNLSNPPPSPDHQNENNQHTEINYSPMNLLDS